MAGDSPRLVGSKQNDIAKIDFLTFLRFLPTPHPRPPYPPTRIHYMGLAPMQRRVTNLCVTTGGELDGHRRLVGRSPNSQNHSTVGPPYRILECTRGAGNALSDTPTHTHTHTHTPPTLLFALQTCPKRHLLPFCRHQHKGGSLRFAAFVVRAKNRPQLQVVAFKLPPLC